VGGKFAFRLNMDNSTNPSGPEANQPPAADIPANLPSTNGPVRHSPLDYGPPLPLLKRRRVQQWIIRSAVLLSVLIVLQQIVPPAWRRARFRYLQSQCMENPVPAGVLVYSSAPSSVSIVRPQLTRFLNAYRNVPFQFPPHSPSGPEDALLLRQPMPLNPNMASVYVGQRQASNGLRRFIAVSTNVAFWSSGLGADISFPIVVRPLGFADPVLDGELGVRYTVAGLDCGWGAPNLRPQPEVLVYSAIEDPADASHFSFTFDVNINHCTVDYWLQPDGQLKMTQKIQHWHVTPQQTRDMNWPDTSHPAPAN